jgi:HSP20 family protein
MRQLDSLLPFAEVRDFADEVRLLFDELEQGHRLRGPATGVYTPSLDVVETDGTIEIFVDLPGVVASSIRVLIKADVVVIAGEKSAPDPAERADASFHLLERGFGRFARAVRLHGAFQAGRATARLTAGVLRVQVPKVEERRGRVILVPIEEHPAR